MTADRDSELAISCAIKNYEGSKTSICVLLGFEVATLVAFATYVTDYSLQGSPWPVTAGFLLLTVAVGLLTLAFAGEYFYDNISPIDEDYEEQIVDDVEKHKELKQKKAKTADDIIEAEIEADTELQKLEVKKDSHLMVLRGDSNRLEICLGMSVISYMLALSAFLCVILSPLLGAVLLGFDIVLMSQMVRKYRTWRHYSEKLA